MAIPLEANLAAVRLRIEQAAERAGRSPGEICLIAVTKTVGWPETLALAESGQKDFGENRVDELERKVQFCRTQGLALRWHFIGHLQSNKARRVVRVADVVHSVDSPQLLERLGRLAFEEGRRLQVFLQLALTGERNKHGLEPERLTQTVAGAPAHSGIELLGLMAMGPLQDGAITTAEVFARAAEWARELEKTPRTRSAFSGGRVRLSLGMSSDYELAIAAGSNFVRVGSALFAPSSAPTSTQHPGAART